MVVKMPVKCIGCCHRSGFSSKSQKDYDFTVLYFVDTRQGVIGEYGSEIIIPKSILGYDEIMSNVPGKFIVSLDPKSGRIFSCEVSK